MEFELTKNQQRIFNTVDTTDLNYLILGEPGVGKSVLIRALTDPLREFDTQEDVRHYSLGAPTGLAALNINGRTLHSLFRLPTSDGIIYPNYNVFMGDGPAYSFIKYRLKRLIIDEISMVRCDQFDYIDRLLRHIKNSTLPFGGVQIIAIGDFYQLPPVVKGREEARQMKEVGYETPFIFSSKVFKNNFKLLLLNEVLRQKGDPDFIDLLAAARTGSMHPRHTKLLNKQVGRPDDLRIYLTCTNKEADIVNQQEMKKINEPEVLFQATKFGEWPAYPAEFELKVKVGAQVMVKMNNADRRSKQQPGGRVVNGTLGVIVEIVAEDPNEGKKAIAGGLELSELENGTSFVPYVKIKLENGDIVPIYTKRWERKVKERDGEDWVERLIASYEQVPIALAWAISIHKSQGQSFDKAHIDLKKVFAPGQGYVALSRVRSMAGVSLENPVTTSMFESNRDVDDFFEFAYSEGLLDEVK